MLMFGAACGDDDADDGNGDPLEELTQSASEDVTPPLTAEETPTADTAAETPGAGGAEGDGTTLEIATLEGLTFTEDELTAPADTEITVEYLNDTPVPHNIHFFMGDSASAESRAQTDIVSGPGATESVTFTTPAEPGDYFFQCDVHPIDMTGSLVVE